MISTHFKNILPFLFLVLPGTGNPDPSREYIFFALFRFTSPPVRPCLGSFSSLPRLQFVLASALFRPCLGSRSSLPVGSFSSMPRLLFVLASASLRLCLASCSSLHASAPFRPCLGFNSSLPRHLFTLACLGSFSSLPRLHFVLASALVHSSDVLTTDIFLQNASVRMPTQRSAQGGETLENVEITWRGCRPTAPKAAERVEVSGLDNKYESAGQSFFPLAELVPCELALFMSRR